MPTVNGESVRTIDEAAPAAHSAAASEGLNFPDAVKTNKKGLRPVVRTVEEAIRLIDKELPYELRALSRWTFARALLVESQRSGKKRDLVCAIRQLKQALSNEGWLAA
jgi:hypothetical protein